MSTVANAFRRLWQPRKGLFWLALGFNALASFMSFYLQTREPPTSLALMVALLALTNSLIGAWLTWRLWNDPPPSVNPSSSDSP